MSSALMWRADPAARMSRILRRGSVTLRPALRRSLLSLVVDADFRRCGMLGPWGMIRVRLSIILTAAHHFDENIAPGSVGMGFGRFGVGLRVSHQRPTGQFLGSGGGRAGEA